MLNPILHYGGPNWISKAKSNLAHTLSQNSMQSALSLLDFTTQKKVGILGMGKHKEEKLLYLK